MPIPTRLKPKYKVVIASQTKRLEEKGLSKANAHSQAKAMAEQVIAKIRKN